ncbi:MAG: hypothetical protein HDR95_07925 [Bacteroides sp.]|nr:hypothetical protein [Bacteroidales bacterium]MBD5337216.1 hypothetical protein [Bacteroides sp.]
MKNTSTKFRNRLVLILATFLAITAFTACDDDDIWAPLGPSGWNYQDSRLTGYWQLINVNGSAVGGYESNFLEFFGNGDGEYYYYRNSRPRSERIAYWCQQSNTGYSNYQINIQYESGQASTMNYWFSDSGRTLYMRWNSTNGVMTYAYARVNGVVW